jgi:HPt (histidine-containing phosphotransfer) domain-containing protein
MNKMTKIIDQDVIDGLIEIGDKEFLTELVDIFLGQSEGLVQEIKNAIEAKNGPELMKAAHKLKGSCLNLGAKELGDICHNLEIKAKDNDFSNVNVIIEPLDDIYHQTCAELIKFK